MKNYIFFFITLAFISCTDSGKDFSVDKHNITIDTWVRNPNFMEKDLIKNIQYIFLETNENCLIGEITKILYYNGIIFIFDRSDSKAIFAFSLNGEYLYKIQKIGRGPGEFIEPWNFDISHQKIHIYDNVPPKIISYKIPSHDFEENKIEFRFEEIFFIEKNKFLFHSVLEENKNRMLLGVYDLKQNKALEIIGARDLLDDFDIPRNTMHSFYESNNILYYYPRFSDYILRISADLTMSKKIILNSELVPDNDYIEMLKDKQKFNNQNDKYITDIINIYESDNFFFMTVVNQFYKNILISKSTGNKKCFLIFDDDRYFGRQTMYGLVENKFISIIDPDQFETTEWLEKVKKSTLADSTKVALTQRKSNENHIISLIEFKNF